MRFTKIPGTLAIGGNTLEQTPRLVVFYRISRRGVNSKKWIRNGLHYLPGITSVGGVIRNTVAKACPGYLQGFAPSSLSNSPAPLSGLKAEPYAVKTSKVLMGAQAGARPAKERKK